MIKIFLISNLYPSKTDPTYGTFVKNFADNLGSDFIISPIAIIKGRSISPIDKLKKYLTFYFKIIYHYLLKKDYNLIYVHYISPVSPLLVLLLLMKKKTIIVNCHGRDITSTNRFFSFSNKILLNKSKGIVCPSIFFKNLVVNKYKINSNKIFVSASGGINMKIFRSPQMNSRKEKISICYVSKIYEQKGWRIFLDSMSALNSKGIPLKISIGGDGKNLKDLKLEIKAKELTEIIDVVGAIPQNRLPDFFAEHDIFIFPTLLEESLGLIGLEAMACGLPVIGSSIGALNEYIISGYNGYLCEVGNPDSITNYILKYIQLTEDEKKIMSQNAMEIAKRYNSKLVTDELKRYLFSIKD